MSDSELRRVAELGGFFAAHGVWSVSNGPALVPFCAVESRDGKRSLTRFAAKQMEDGVAQARELFSQSPPGAMRAALVYDAYVTFDWGKTDTLIIEARSYVADAAFTMLVPYRNAKAGFAVFRPKLRAISPSGVAPGDVVEPFFAGVDAHTEAAAVWNAHMDQSR